MEKRPSLRQEWGCVQPHGPGLSSHTLQRDLGHSPWCPVASALGLNVSSEKCAEVTVTWAGLCLELFPGAAPEGPLVSPVTPFLCHLDRRKGRASPLLALLTSVRVLSTQSSAFTSLLLPTRPSTDLPCWQDSHHPMGQTDRNPQQECSPRPWGVGQARLPRGLLKEERAPARR